MLFCILSYQERPQGLHYKKITGDAAEHSVQPRAVRRRVPAETARKGEHHQKCLQQAAQDVPRPGLPALLRLAMRGVTTQLANPKPAVFFGAVFITLVPAHAGPGLFAAILGVVFVNEFVWNLVVARIFSLETARLGYTRLKSGIDRVLGGLLAALGVKIAAF